MVLPDAIAVRYALSALAYRTDTVRLGDTDLAGWPYLVATNAGLFVVDHGRSQLVAYGFFYGLTMIDDLVFAFETSDRIDGDSAMGRIVRFRIEGGRIASGDVLDTGLDCNCHQIDVIGDDLCVLDTQHQRVLLYPLAGGEPRTIVPIPYETLTRSGGYVHVNSLLATDDHILLMLHNGGHKSGKPSEVARLDRDWTLIDRVPVDGLGCHSLAILEDGEILTCGSLAGELISPSGLRVPICDMMTRGLAVSDAEIAVGGSGFGDRASRANSGGAVYFLDRRYNHLGHIDLPGPVMDIRRTDGRDRSLSKYLTTVETGPLRLRAPEAQPSLPTVHHHDTTRLADD